LHYRIVSSKIMEHPHAPHPLALLRPRRERPRGRRAAEQRYERASSCEVFPSISGWSRPGPARWYASIKHQRRNLGTGRGLRRSKESTQQGPAHKVIVCQALIGAVVGFCLAAAIGFIVVAATADTALPIVMTPVLMLVLFLLTLVMCVVSAIAAIVQVMRIDPVMVFTR
jgi:hypothetical protein